MEHIAGKLGRAQALYILHGSNKPAQLSYALRNTGN